MGMYVYFYIEMFKLPVASAVYKLDYSPAEWKDAKGDVKHPTAANFS